MKILLRLKTIEIPEAERSDKGGQVMGGARPCDMHLRNTQLKKKHTQLAQHAAEEETHCVLHT